MAIGWNFLPLLLRPRVKSSPPVPDVNLQLILVKVHMRLLEWFDQYWWCTRGEKVDYALKKK